MTARAVVLPDPPVPESHPLPAEDVRVQELHGPSHMEPVCHFRLQCVQLLKLPNSRGRRGSVIVEKVWPNPVFPT